jgi:predicted ATPase
MGLLSATLPPPDVAFPWSLPLLRHIRDLAFAPSLTVLVGREQAELRDRAAAGERAAAHLHDGERRRREPPFLGPVAAADNHHGAALDARSHGEPFLAFFRGRLRGPGLYLLDEPEAFLRRV